jgi:hypothetical protein
MASAQPFSPSSLSTTDPTLRHYLHLRPKNHHIDRIGEKSIL